MYASFCDVMVGDLTKVVKFGRYTEKWISDAPPAYSTCIRDSSTEYTQTVEECLSNMSSVVNIEGL